MPSTYSSSLRLELMATGENSNTWGIKTNSNLNLLEQAITGYEAITLVSASSTYSLPVADASASPGRNAFIEFKGTVASAISIVIPDIEKGYWIKNSATGSPLTFRTSAGTGVTLPTNQWVFLISDGASVVDTTPTSLTNYARTNQVNTFTAINNFTSAVNIAGSVSITGTAVVSGSTTLASSVDIKGATSLASTLVANGNSTFNGNVSVSGTFLVSGATTLASSVDIKGATSLASTLVANGNSTFNGNVSVSGTFLVSGVATFASAVDIKGAASLASTLVVAGNATLNGSVSVSGSFAVSGAATFTSVVNIRANASVVGNFLVSGATTLASTVDIKGATSIASTLVVAGSSTFLNGITIGNNVSATGPLTITEGSRFRILPGALQSQIDSTVDVGQVSACLWTFRNKSVLGLQGTVRMDGIIVSCSNTTFRLTDYSLISFGKQLQVNTPPYITGADTSAGQSITIAVASTFGVEGYINLGADCIYNIHFESSVERFRVKTSTVCDYGLQVKGSATVLGDGVIPDGSRLLVIYNGTAPVSSTEDGVILYAEDVSSSSELRVRDEAGNVTTLSPHNFQLCGGPSEDLAWSHYGEKNGKAINVDMLKMARILEKISGEKLVYVGDAP